MMQNKEPPSVLDERRADKGYLAHLHRLAMAESVVDHHPPLLQTYFYHNITRLAEGADQLRRISKENKMLVQAINMINRTKGRTDTHLRPYVRHDNLDTNTLPIMTMVEKENKKIHDHISKTVARYSFLEQRREWKLMKRVMHEQSKYPWDMSRLTQLRLGRRWTIERLPTADEDLARVRALRPRVFLEFATAERHLGRIEFVLYGDVVPVTVANFVSLIRGDGPEALSYRRTPMFRVTPSLYCQGGDVVRSRGVGNCAAHGGTFADENYVLRHSGPGVLSMCNYGMEDNNGSQFRIAFRALHSLDGRTVVFGKMTRGEQTLFNIENLGTRCGKPIKDIIVTRCGEVDHKDLTMAEPVVKAPTRVEFAPMLASKKCLCQ